MKEKKIKIAIQCLLLTALVQVLTLGYEIYRVTEIRAQYARLNLEGPQTPLPNLFGMSAIITALQIVVTYFLIQDLKRGKGWAWVTSILLFLVCAPSWALPAVIFGLIALLDERVRGDFIKELDIHI